VANLTVLHGPDKGRIFQVSADAELIGRGSKTIPLSDSSVSRRHAELRRDNGLWTVADLGSANGTYVNNKRIDGVVPLRSGDKLRMGGTLLIWAGDDPVIRSAQPLDQVNLDAAAPEPDISVVSSVAGNDDSVILASPAAADAVRAWRVMAQLADAIGSVSSPAQLVERVLDILFDEIPLSRAFILMRDSETAEFVPAAVRFRNPGDKEDPVTTSKTIISHVVTHRAGVLCSNALADERFAARRRSGSLQAFTLRSVICVPIMARDDVLGVIHIDSPMARHIYTEDQLRLVTAIGRMSGVAVENARLVAQRMDTARLAAVGQAVASLSHSIKNILHGMRGGSDVVDLGLARQQLATIDQGWQIVQRNVERIYNLTLNMLAYSKDRVPRLELVQLNPIVKEAVGLLARRAEDKAVAVMSDLEEPFPPIPLDADGMQQVILNILSNAIDAVPKSGGVIRIRTRYDPTAMTALLTIGDNGSGIAPEQMPHLFEPFRSTKGHGGTGLGLAVARKVVEEHRGTINVKSEPGHGTLVTIMLPASAPPAADSTATVAPATRKLD
jgi:two-component system NtrC family sensor kinase